MSDDLAVREANEAVFARMNQWFELHWGRLPEPLTLDTEVERAYGITGDDIWTMLEWVVAELPVDPNRGFMGPQHFYQESGMLQRRPIEPLTPRVFARYLLPVPELTLKVMEAISKWCLAKGIEPRMPVLATHWIEDIVAIRGRRTWQMITSVGEQLNMTLSHDFEARRHLQHPNLLIYFFTNPPIPLTPQLLAEYLRPVSLGASTALAGSNFPADGRR